MRNPFDKVFSGKSRLGRIVAFALFLSTLVWQEAEAQRTRREVYEKAIDYANWQLTFGYTKGYNISNSRRYTQVVDSFRVNINDHYSDGNILVSPNYYDLAFFFFKQDWGNTGFLALRIDAIKEKYIPETELDAEGLTDTLLWFIRDIESIHDKRLMDIGDYKDAYVQVEGFFENQLPEILDRYDELGFPYEEMVERIASNDTTLSEHDLSLGEIDSWLEQMDETYPKTVERLDELEAKTEDLKESIPEEIQEAWSIEQSSWKYWLKRNIPWMITIVLLVVGIFFNHFMVNPKFRSFLERNRMGFLIAKKNEIADLEAQLKAHDKELNKLDHDLKNETATLQHARKLEKEIKEKLMEFEVLKEWAEGFINVKPIQANIFYFTPRDFSQPISFEQRELFHDPGEDKMFEAAFLGDRCVLSFHEHFDWSKPSKVALEDISDTYLDRRISSRDKFRMLHTGTSIELTQNGNGRWEATTLFKTR